MKPLTRIQTAALTIALTAGVVVLLVAEPLPARADKKKGEKTIDIAAAVARVQSLTAAGRLDYAEEMLGTLPVPERVRARLQGVIALERGDYELAAREFEAALATESGEGKGKDPHLSLYLAHAYVKLGRFDAALRTLPATRPLADELVAQPLVEAHALHGAGQIERAFAVLEGAAKRFPGETGPKLELIAIASQQQLRTMARQLTKDLLTLDIDRETALGVIHALHRDPRAAALLEQIAARFPADAEIRAHIAHGYAAREHWYTAGLLFEQASLLGGDYAFEAADQYRLAGATRRALVMNGRVGDDDKRLRQRLSILYTAGDMARVIALESDLADRGIEDEPTLYRLAYAHFALSEYARATQFARRLLGTSYEEQAKSLLAVMGRATTATSR